MIRPDNRPHQEFTTLAEANPHSISMVNSLLALLPSRINAELRPLMTRVWLEADTQLFGIEDRPDFVYFPDSGIVAVIAGETEGRHCFVGFYGCEGFGSVVAVMGIPTTPNYEVVQFSGFAHQIRTDDLQLILDSHGEFRRILMSYVHIFMLQISCTALAMQTRVEQRLARLLLMYQDRLHSPSLPVTHQRLSDTLCVRRSGITEAIHLLEANHLVRAERGHIFILDRAGLIDLTAGSYGPPEAEYHRLF